MTCSVESSVRVTRNVKHVTSGTDGLRDTLRLTRSTNRLLFDRAEPVPLLPLLLVLTIVWCCGAQSWAEVAAKPAGDVEEKVRYGEITGTVSAVNNMGIAVEHSRTRTGSSEMYLPFGAQVKLERLRSLAELQPGARVKVRYEQVYQEGKEDQPIILKTVATAVSLVRSAPTEGTLGSREEATE